MSKIIIETNLKKIPDSCTQCKYSVYFCQDRCCGVVFENKLPRLIPYTFIPERKNWCYVKPDWCPIKNEYLSNEAYWESIILRTFDGKETSGYRCSNCHTIKPEYEVVPFCFHCGAKMIDKGKK